MNLETVKALHKKYPKKLGGKINCKKSFNYLGTEPEEIECKPSQETTMAGYKCLVKYNFYKKKLRTIVVGFDLKFLEDMRDSFTHKYGKSDSSADGGINYRNDVSSIFSFLDLIDEPVSYPRVTVFFSHYGLRDEYYDERKRNEKIAEDAKQQAAKERSNDL